MFPSLKSACGGKKQGMQRCVWGRAARAPGPASECPTNSVVEDTLQVPVSTFAPCFTAVCMRTSQLRRRGHFAVPVSTFAPSFTDVCMRTSREYLYVCECRRKRPAPTMCSPAAGSVCRRPSSGPARPSTSPGDQILCLHCCRRSTCAFAPECPSVPATRWMSLAFCGS